MPKSTGIRNVKVADPGVSFILELEDSLFGENGFDGVLRLDVVVIVGSNNSDFTHISRVYINGPRPLLNRANGFFIVAPYGCRDYHPQGVIDLEVIILKKLANEKDYTEWKIISPSEVITAQSGIFSIDIASS